LALTKLILLYPEMKMTIEQIYFEHIIQIIFNRKLLGNWKAVILYIKKYKELNIIIMDSDI
jgi:hypothetical protein